MLLTFSKHNSLFYSIQEIFFVYFGAQKCSLWHRMKILTFEHSFTLRNNQISDGAKIEAVWRMFNKCEFQASHFLYRLSDWPDFVKLQLNSLFSLYSTSALWSRKFSQYTYQINRHSIWKKFYVKPTSIKNHFTDYCFIRNLDIVLMTNRHPYHDIENWRLASLNWISETNKYLFDDVIFSTCGVRR